MRQTLWCYSYLYIHIKFIYPSNWCAFLVPHKEVTHPSHWSQTFFWVKSSVINHRSRLTCGTVPGFAPCVTFLLRSPACQMMVRPSSRPLGFCRDFVGHVSRLSSWVFPGSMGKPWEALLMEITRPLPRLRLVWMSELKATYCGLRNGCVHMEMANWNLLPTNMIGLIQRQKRWWIKGPLYSWRAWFTMVWGENWPNMTMLEAGGLDPVATMAG